MKCENRLFLNGDGLTLNLGISAQNEITIMNYYVYNKKITRTEGEVVLICNSS